MNNPRDKMKFIIARPANKNYILTMKIKWHWSEIILDCPQKNTYPFLKSYRITRIHFPIFFKCWGKKRKKNGGELY